MYLPILHIARCSLGHIGVVTGFERVRYPDGTRANAWVGRHVWPLRLLGRRWSSRNPRWLT